MYAQCVCVFARECERKMHNSLPEQDLIFQKVQAGRHMYLYKPTL